MVKVKWMPLALIDLRCICEYYRIVKKSPKTSQLLKQELILSSNTLETFPFGGAIELLLANEEIEFRYLVVRKHYKLIYFVENDVANIVAVWDCRQNPDKLFEMLTR
ncbi:type II toxin-antitoxin system RelE/ParE family toxin [uncultured Bacteroides sp.]|uniref:type II toxin-antitoxin system RelE/ParE family toxin n=1 Tax=uncultured Bacteroides sp. TaxID=162156 RepID=UPI0025D45146|nr:type II toxin-antitoxin system RelE/ParE family toxin [uncultured Bacteroides sp.]